VEKSERRAFDRQLEAQYRMNKDLMDELLNRVEANEKRMEILLEHCAALEGSLPELGQRPPTKLELMEKDAQEAVQIAIEWCDAVGWATGHGDTLSDILREMRAQHCYEKLAARVELRGE